MIDLEFVQALIRTVDESSIDSVEIERGGTRIRVSKTPPQAASPQAAPAASAAANPPPAAPEEGGANHPGGAPAGGGGAAAGASAPAPEAPDAAEDGFVEITSPMVGTFYRSPSPGADAFTEVGRRIAPGDTLCIIEAMKLMNELEAEVDGTIREICVENGEPVEYGQVLFRVEPA